jgi:cellulose synthase/poly-beta-1,6-N-acetylglucosamine synthase-like glycosyltransferase
MADPKILIGCPTYEGYEYCLNEYVEGIKNLTYKDTDVLIADNSKTDAYKKKLEAKGLPTIRTPHLPDVRERIIHARNVLREHVLKNDYEYFLSLEQDVIPPPDVIERLIRHQKPVVSGVYYKKFHVTYTHHGKPIKKAEKIMPLICTLLPGMESSDRAHLCSPQEVEGNKFFRIRGAGLGCILIHRSILEKVKFRTDEEKGTFDDLCFSNDLYKLKIPMYVDTSVKCKHLITKKYDKMFDKPTTP